MKYALILCLFLAGCGIFRGSLQLDSTADPVRPAQDLYIIGRWLIYAGGFGIAAGIVALAFTRSAIVGTAIVAAVGTCLLGITLSWFGQNPWAVWVVTIGTGLVMAYRHRGVLRRLIRR